MMPHWLVAGLRCRAGIEIMLASFAVIACIQPKLLLADQPRLEWRALDATPDDTSCKPVIFEQPRAIAVDRSGTIYVANEKGINALQRISSAGAIETLLDRRSAALANNHYFELSLAIDTKSRVILGVGARATIEQLGANGTLSILAGIPGKAALVDGVKTVALFRRPKAVAVDRSGNIYVADSRTIRKLGDDGSVVTVAGKPSADEYALDGRGSRAVFGSLNGITIDAEGNLYVADGGTRKDEGRTVAFGLIRKVDRSGIVTTFAGSLDADGSHIDGTGPDAGFDIVDAITVDSVDNLFVTESYGSVRKIDSAGKVTSIVDHLRRYDEPADRDGADPIFQKLTGIAVDMRNQIYVVDSEAGKLHRIDGNAYVTTLCRQSAAVLAK